MPPLSRASLRRAWREHDWLRDKGTAAVVTAAQRCGVGRVIRDSVTFLHADGGQQWIDEDWPLDPGPHLAAAVAAERHVAGFHGTGVVLRLALLYGPMSAHTRQALQLGRRAGVSVIVGPGQAYLASLHHDDAAVAVAALDIEPGTYDVGDDEPMRRDDLVFAQAAAVGRARLLRPPSALARGAAAETQTRSHRVSAARFRAASGWRPSYPSARECWQQVAAELAG